MNNLEKKIIRRIENTVGILECMKDDIENGELSLLMAFNCVDEVHDDMNSIEEALEKLDQEDCE